MSVETPLVSIVIPAYNQAEFLGEAIQSVLNQTYANFEVIVVDDASPDNTAEVARRYCDPRVTYIAHGKNLGLPAARNTGMLAASGHYIALLDSDDYFHPDKLAAHMNYLSGHPEVGVTYNSRFDLDYSARTIRRLWRPPAEVSLADLVLGFPFTPSDMVIRREWAFQVGLFDPQYVCGGEDTDFPCRLALAGCKFASVDRALNYRRYHAGRPRKRLRCRLDDVVRAQETIFRDPRCPNDVLTLRDTALQHHLMVLVYVAFSQEETSLGEEFIRELIQIQPAIVKGSPCELIDFLLEESAADENADHESVLRRILVQLPSKYMFLTDQLEWATGQGYIRKGVRNIIWGRNEQGEMHLNRAMEAGATLEVPFLQRMVAHLLDYEVEFGSPAAMRLLVNLCAQLDTIGTRSDLQQLRGSYHINRAFDDYRNNRVRQVPGHVIRAVTSDLSHLANRGAVSIAMRSLSRFFL